MGHRGGDVVHIGNDPCAQPLFELEVIHAGPADEKFHSRRLQLPQIVDERRFPGSEADPGVVEDDRCGQRVKRQERVSEAPHEYLPQFVVSPPQAVRGKDDDQGGAPLLLNSPADDPDVGPLVWRRLPAADQADAEGSLFLLRHGDCASHLVCQTADVLHCLVAVGDHEDLLRLLQGLFRQDDGFGAGEPPGVDDFFHACLLAVFEVCCWNHAIQAGAASLSPAGHCADRFQGGVDLGLRVEEAEPESDGTPGKRSDGSVGRRGAVKSGPRHDGEPFVQFLGRLRRRQACDVERDDGDTARRIDRAVQIDSGDLAKTAHEPPHQGLLVGADRFDTAGDDPGDTGGQAREADGVWCSGLELVGEKERLLFEFGAAPRSTRHEGADPRLQPFPDVEAARSRGAEKRFVASECHEVDPQRFDGDRQDPRRLRRIDDQDEAVFVGDPARFADGEDRPRDIRGVGEDDCFGVRADGRRDCCRVELAPDGTREDRYLDPLPLQCPQRPHDRVVLHRRGNDMVAPVQEPPEGDIERLGGVLRKNDPEGVVRTEESRHRLARIQDDPASIDREPVPGAARRAADLTEVPVHGALRLLRFRPGGRGVIEI